MSNSTEAGNSADLQDAFPVVDPGAFPLGARVLVQMRLPKKKVAQHKCASMLSSSSRISAHLCLFDGMIKTC